MTPWLFSIWWHKDARKHTLVEGTAPPRDEHGHLLHTYNRRVRVFEARDWQEAGLRMNNFLHAGGHPHGD